MTGKSAFKHPYRAVLVLFVLSVVLTACTPVISVKGIAEAINEMDSERQPVVFPDINPSIPDGRIVWSQQGCAACHGAYGAGAGGASADITHAQTVVASPVSLYKLAAYGSPIWEHPRLKGKVSERQLWDLVFFVRSFAARPLSDNELKQLEPIYGANCADCHGASGYGDGPLSSHLEPLAANFHQYNRFFDRRDEMLFNHISEGLYPTAMPAFYGRVDKLNGIVFNQIMIKKLVAYVRHFHTDTRPTDISKDNQDKHTD